MKRLAAVAVAVWTLATLAALTFGGGLDYGEGPLVDQASRLLHGEPLYRWPLDAAPWTVTNYPPLYAATVALVARLTGAPLVACGRALAATAALTGALLIRSLGARVWRSPPAGDLALALFLCHPAVLIWSGYARVDLVALAFSLAAVRLVAVAAPRRRDLVAALVCLVAAAATKQTYVVAAPLACTVALAARSRRQAAGLAAAWALVLGCLFVLAERLTGGGFARHVLVANANPWSAPRAARLVAWGLVAAAPALALACRLPRRPPPPLVAFVVGGVMTSLLGGKLGSHVNYLLESAAALALIAAGAAARLPPATLTRLFACAVVPSLALGLPELATRFTTRATANALAAAIRATDGIVLADDLATLVAAGRPVVYQPFEMRQLAGQEPRALLDALGSRAVALVVVGAADSAVARQRWSPSFFAALDRSYRRREQLGDYTLYRPTTDGDAGRGPCATARR